MWLKDLRANASPDIKIFLIGNKTDLEEKRQVKKEEGESIKNDYELELFMETSAKTGMNANELFIEAAKLLFKDYSEYKIKNAKKEVHQINPLSLNKPAKNKGCCN